MIKDLVDENTLYCNTDSLVSLVPRNDLNIGTNIDNVYIINLVNVPIPFFEK